MADETTYTYLSHPSQPSSATPTRPSRGSYPCQGSRRHWIALWIGWAGNAILLATVTVLVFQIRQHRDVLEKTCTSPTQNNGINKTGLEKVAQLRQYVCMSLENTTESSSCKICPHKWYLHDKKCYWISTEKLTWNQSRENCTAMLSQMLVIQDLEEMAFIENVTKSNKILWIGLRITSSKRKWTWVDGSPFNDKLPHKLGPTEQSACGRLNGNQIISDGCTHPTHWICEKEALLV